MEILGCQLDIAWENPEANYLKVRDLMATIAPANEDSLLVLPELFATGFSMNLEKTIETGTPTPSEKFLAELANEQHCGVMGGFATASKNDPKRGQNELAVFDANGKKIARYQKNRAFTYTGEAEFYEPASGITVFDWAGWKVCPLICYDLRFPELFRRGAAAGAELFTVIASWPKVRDDHWVTLLRARAIENLAYVIGVNRCGTDPNFDYSGRSIIVDPWGEIIVDAGSDETLIQAEIDLEKLREWRAAFPALEDMEFL